MEIHEESLLRIPLVSQMINDPQVKIVKRAVDSTWSYQGVVPQRLSGFNPFQSSIYVSAISEPLKWLNEPRNSARPFNKGDFLVKEILNMVHDYLHCWAYLAINDLRPDLGIGVTPITPANFDDFVFCHLLTEAVAVVGLDFWYLWETDLNQVCKIGTKVKSCAMGYQHEDLAQFQDLNKNFNPTEKDFFKIMVGFYCVGEIPGFEIPKMKSESLQNVWADEVLHVRLHRMFVQQWLAYLSVDVSPRVLGEPVPISQPWQLKLIDQIGELLWAKIREGQSKAFRVGLDTSRVWQSQMTKPIDWRFVNYNFSTQGSDDWDNFLFNQMLACHFFKDFSPKDLQLIKQASAKHDFKLLHKTLSQRDRIPVKASEPRDLFFPN